MNKMIIIPVYRASHEPTPAQLKAGKYPKRRVPWHGLTIRIENEAGSVRRGTKPDGTPWETRMLYPYGYVERSEGSDGDEVDITLGPDPNAELVYVIHQRRVGDWKNYDEDKCMADFSSQDDAVTAFLACYDDPRFLGPVTAMPVDEFVEKVKATRNKPGMIKSEPVILLLKSYVPTHTRRLQSGKVITVTAYSNRKTKRIEADGQLDMFAQKPKEEPKTHVGEGVIEPTQTNQESDRLDFDPAAHVKLAADSIDKLRVGDIHRLFEEAPSDIDAWDDLRVYIIENRPEFGPEVMDVIDEIGQPERKPRFSPEERAAMIAENKAKGEKIRAHLAAGGEIHLTNQWRSTRINSPDMIKIGSDGVYVATGLNRKSADGRRWDYLFGSHLDEILRQIPEKPRHIAAHLVDDINARNEALLRSPDLDGQTVIGSRFVIESDHPNEWFVIDSAAPDANTAVRWWGDDAGNKTFKTKRQAVAAAEKMEAERLRTFDADGALLRARQKGAEFNAYLNQRSEEWARAESAAREEVKIPGIGSSTAWTILHGAARGDKALAAKMTAKEMLEGISKRRFDLWQRATLSGLKPETTGVVDLADDYENSDGKFDDYLSSLRGQAAFDFLIDAVGDKLGNAMPKPPKAKKAKATASTESPTTSRKYYVTMVRDPGPRQKIAWLAGPFDDHETALGHVDAARTKANEVDPRAAFDAFGTSSFEADDGKHPPGRLNDLLGVGKS